MKHAVASDDPITVIVMNMQQWLNIMRENTSSPVVLVIVVLGY